MSSSHTDDSGSTLKKLKELFESELDRTDLAAVVSNLLKCVSHDESLECAIYVLENAGQCIAVEYLEENVFKLACPVVLASFTTAIAGIKRLDEGAQLTQSAIDPLYALLTSCSVTLQTLSATCGFFEISVHEEVQFGCVKSLLMTMQEVIELAEPVAKKFQSDKYALCGGVFKDDLASLKKEFLSILSSKVKLTTTDDDLLDDIKSIISGLVGSLTASPPKVDTMGQTLETWKIVINWFLHVKETFDMSSGITYLCESMSKFLERLVEATANELKMYNILLKILIKLCSLFRNFSDSCWKSMIGLIVRLFGLTSAFLESSGHSLAAAEAITNSIANGATPFLDAFLPAGQDFAPLLMKRISAEVINKPYGCLLLLLSLLKKLASSRSLRKTYFNTDVNVLDGVFNCIGSCHSGILQDLYLAPGNVPGDLYEHTVINVSAFTITLKPDKFSLAEETIWTNIIQPNPWKAMLACDILCVVARYADSGLCHSMVENMIFVVKEIEDPNSRPEFVYITALLKRMLPLCQDEFIVDLFKRFPESSRVWAVLGLHLMSSQREEEFVRSVMKWLEDCIEDPDGIVRLEALATTSKDAPLIAPISELVEDLWLFKNSREVPVRFLMASLSTTAGGISNLPSNTILEVTEHILRLLSEPNINPSILLSIIQFMERAAESKLPTDNNGNNALENIGNAFQSILASKNSALRILAFKTLLKFAEKSMHTRVVKVAVGTGSEFYDEFVSFVKKELPSSPEELSYPFEYVHRCSEKVLANEEGLEVAPKKMKLDNSCSEEASQMIRNFESTASQILPLASSLTNSQRDALLRVCQTIANKLK